MPSIIVSIPGIHCSACARLIEDVSSEFAAIQNITVDLEQKTVRIDHASDFQRAAWSKAIEALGDAYRIA
jgi:copper chaperone CopZ